MIVFAKDDKGQWRVFPNHLLTEYNGKLGLYLTGHHFFYGYSVNKDDYGNKSQVLAQFGHLFEKTGAYWPDEFYAIKEQYYDQ